MKKCILVWQVPVIEGEPYNPVVCCPCEKSKKVCGSIESVFCGKKYGLQLRAGQISL